MKNAGFFLGLPVLAVAFVGRAYGSGQHGLLGDEAWGLFFAQQEWRSASTGEMARGYSWRAAGTLLSFWAWWKCGEV